MKSYKLKSPLLASKITGVFYQLEDGSYVPVSDVNQFNVGETYVHDGIKPTVIPSADFEAKYEEAAAPLA